MALALALLGCGPRERVVWDAVGGGDSVDDVVVAVLLFGKVESDREEIDGPHVAGGTLEIHATTHGFGGETWSAATLEPDIAEVVSATPASSGLRLELAFHRPGTTWLHVFDEQGIVIDQQRLEVRDAAQAELIPWDQLQSGQAEPVPGAIDVVGGSQLSLAVTWADATGAVLDGGGLLSVDAPDAPAGLSVSANFTGVVDTLDLGVPPNAGVAGFEVELAARGVPIDIRNVVVHERAEVDALELAVSDVGTVGATVLAAGTRMIGAPVMWTWDQGDPQSGSVLLFDASEEGAATKVQACFDALCQLVSVPGTPTGVADAAAPSASSCGCHSSGSGAPWVALATLLGLLRRATPRALGTGADRRPEPSAAAAARPEKTA